MIYNKRIAVVFCVCCLLLAGCAAKENEEAAPDAEGNKQWFVELFAWDACSVAGEEIEKLMQSMKEEIELVQKEREMEEKLQLDIPRDYDVREYMDKEVMEACDHITSYFLKKDGYGYELVISQTGEEEGWLRDVKVFVSKEENSVFCLQQVLDDEAHDGGAWDSEGLYLIDVNFDGEDDIVVQNGRYGAQGAAGYSCYLGSNKTYERCESFEEIPNASVDAKNKMILGTNRNSAVSHSYLVYQFKSGSFQLGRHLTIDAELKGEEQQAEDSKGNKNYIRRYTIQDGSGNVLEAFTSEEKDEAYIESKIYGLDSYWQLNNYNNRWNSIEPIGTIVTKAQYDHLPDKEPDTDGYFEDEIVYLGNYSISGKIGGKKYDTLILYGSRDEDGNGTNLIFSLDGELYETTWHWANGYKTAPSVVVKDLDEDRENEILITGLESSGTGLWAESMCVLDMQQDRIIAQTLGKNEISQRASEEVDFTYNRERNSVIFSCPTEPSWEEPFEDYEYFLPDWTKDYPCTGEVDYSSQIEFDAEAGTVKVMPQIACTNSLPYSGIVIEFKVTYYGWLGLEFVSITQEEE